MIVNPMFCGSIFTTYFDDYDNVHINDRVLMEMLSSPGFVNVQLIHGIDSLTSV
jgi:hypothetical protein